MMAVSRLSRGEADDQVLPSIELFVLQRLGAVLGQICGEVRAVSALSLSPEDAQPG
ncbi:hypothetical protein [Bradyrhizobium erythrophlei]|jgi:hypothetical protein|uniref:hypothetical protein n=1 Tax=Bradyrhizobium erythrophlei TaxID=1437360 RepID=UPI0012AC3B33|nr:hypothetical protein [Bradyrhizobium erythrophlei]